MIVSRYKCDARIPKTDDKNIPSFVMHKSDGASLKWARAFEDMGLETVYEVLRGGEVVSIKAYEVNVCPKSCPGLKFPEICTQYRKTR